MDIDLPDGVTVILVNKYNKDHVLRRKEGVKTSDGRIPLEALCKEWSMRDVHWAETDAPVGFDKKGWSDIAFSFMDEVILKAEVTGLNQMNASRDYINKKKFTPKTANAHSSPTTTYIIQDDTKPELHPNVERKNVLTSVVKSSKEATPVESSIPIAKSVTTSGIKPLVSVTSPSKPTTTVNAPAPVQPVSSPSNGRLVQVRQITKSDTKNVLGTDSTTPTTVTTPTKTTPVKVNAPAPVQNDGGDGVYAKLEKLAGLKDRGILTQEEFDHQKKQLLGL